jgi:putative transposase
METQTIKQFSDTRKERAKAILQIGEPQVLDEFTYLVPSQFDSNKKYHVTHIDSYTCECEDFKRRCLGKGIFCKHINAIIIFEKLKHKYEIEEKIEKDIELIIQNPHKDLCPYCHSEKLIKRGVRKTKIGDKQRFSCSDCKKRFVLTPIPKIKGTPKLICLAMDCYYKGLSYRDISDQFKQFYNLNLSHETIRDWVLRFSETMEKYSKTLTPKTSGIWNADETLVLTKRGKDKKNQNAEFDYLWNVMDKKSTFLLASENSGRGRSSKDAQNVFTEAWKQNKKMPNQIITDKLPAYQDGVRKTFRNWGNERKVKHTSILGQRRIINNNAIENLHTHQKEMLKVRRGVTEVQKYADGFKVFHNFVRKGVKDKLTPADKCEIGIQDKNRWETMLINSLNSHKKQVSNLYNLIDSSSGMKL